MGLPYVCTTSRVLAVISLLAVAVLEAQDCTVNQYKKLLPSGSSECIDCPNCPAGYGLIVKCGTTIPQNTRIQCERCVKGVSYSKENGHEQCRPCGHCAKDQVMTPCAPDHSTICYPSCKSKENYYSKSSNDCQPCSWCCEDGKDVVEDECVKKGNAIKQRCTVQRKTMCTPSHVDITTETPQAVTNSTVPTIGPTDSKNKKEDNKSDVKFIVAIIIGVFAGVFLLIAILFFVRKYCTYVRSKQCSHWYKCRCIRIRCDSDDQELCIIGADIRLFDWFKKGKNWQVKEEICTKLNSDDSFAKVAHHFHIMDEDQIRNIEKRSQNPAKEVLYKLCTSKPALTMSEFIECTDEIKRKDISLVLKEAQKVNTNVTTPQTTTSQATIPETTSPQATTSQA